MNEQKTIPVTTLMDYNLDMRLRVLAARLRKSRAELVRDIITEFLPEFENRFNNGNEGEDD